MIHCGKRLEKFLNLLLVFLLPTQLALHFWPGFAFVFGIRVDYLAPTIYLTDILFAVLFIFWIFGGGRNRLFIYIRKNKIYIAVFLLMAALNILFSSSQITSLLKWLKLIEVALFAFYVWTRKNIFGNKEFSSTLFCSLIFFSLIGIVQVIKGGTIGGFFYFLGERNFSIITPGIALGRIGQTLFLRAYSTFSHPNSFAGYLVVGLLLVLSKGLGKLNLVKTAGLLIILIAYLFAFSLSSSVGILISLLIYLIYKKGLLKKKAIPLLTLLFFGLSLIFPIVSGPIIHSGINFTQSTSQRLELADVAGKLISNNYLIGTGLNTFISREVKVAGANSYLWLLQPVHNIYLLIICESGILGGLLFYFLITKILQSNFEKKKIIYFSALIIILVTGLFDHYWFTLQQNLFLFSLLVGKSYSIDG